jgi:hypothetical protein
MMPGVFLPVATLLRVNVGPIFVSSRWGAGIDEVLPARADDRRQRYVRAPSRAYPGSRLGRGALGLMQALALATLGSALSLGAAESKFSDALWVSLFNGRDLTGWMVKCQPRDQDKVFWRADDGTILCDSLGRRDHNYVWLVSEREFGDFELKLKFQAYTDSPGNSGVQFRSRYDTNAENGGWLDGPQVDIHPPAAQSWRTGLIYDETRGERRWVSPSLPNSKIGAEFKPAHHVFKYAGDGDGWNDLTIIAQGTRVRTIVNGVVRTDWDGAGILDNAAHVRRNVGRTGHFALQLHTGDQLRIRFKDILVRELKPSESTTTGTAAKTRN